MSTAKPDIVTPEQWRSAREALLKREKAHTRARDALAAERDTVGFVTRDEEGDPSQLRVRISNPDGAARALEIIRGLAQPVASFTGPRTPKTIANSVGVSMPNGIAVTSSRPVRRMSRMATAIRIGDPAAWKPHMRGCPHSPSAAYST